MNYRVTLFGKQLYKDISLQNELSHKLKIGTTKECHVRLAKEQVYTDFVVRVVEKDGAWSMQADDTVYLKRREENGLYINDLVPGDIISVYCSQPDKLLFTVEFSVDFEEQNKDFNRKIFCADKSEITIGGRADCMVKVIHPLLANEAVRLVKNQDALLADATGCTYGISVNGCNCTGKDILISEGSIFAINGFAFYYSQGYLYTSSTFQLATDLPADTWYDQKNHLKYPKFVRSARQRYVIPEEKINVLPPTAQGEEKKKGLFSTMAPMLASMGMMVLMRMTMGGNWLFIVLSVGMSSVSIIMTVINYRSESTEYKKRTVKRENDYNLYIAEQEEKIKQLREKERRISQQKVPSVEQELKFVEDFDARLYEKMKIHDDFLWVRLGEGVAKSKNQVEFKAPEFRENNDPLMDYPELLHDKYQYIEQMPVVLELGKINAAGFVGDRSKLYQMTKNLILHFCIEHYHQDVKLFLMMNEEDAQFFEWARWFGNFTDERSGIRQFMYDEESRKKCMEQLYLELSSREKEKNIDDLPYCIVMVYRSEFFAQHPVSKYVENATKLGFCFLFFEEYEEYLNQYCQKRIFLKQNQFSGYMQDIENGEAIQEFQYQRIAKERAEAAALKMSSVYMDDVSLEASLTKNISLFQLLGIMNVYDLELGERWSNSQIYKSMAAPLGVKSGDEVVYLDLHEKFHGPHGLVAGTTGSGKSEILQSYILSMATLFHPYEVGFIIIDFKGGGMVNQFRNLPHLNGAITNIDGDEINRSLSAIKAELQKRQKLFAEKEVNHIDDYIRLFKEGNAETPLPHLILIVDEFAELKSEQPEFMKELISAARIGRSLGVHLILATQKPAGVVNDQIWSNSKFKLCLKVQNKADSNEVLKSPLAAEIREPGRAYLQVGNNEIFQLFQSAYSGAGIPNDMTAEQKKFKISKVGLDGSRQVVYEQKPKENTNNVTQLDAIVAYIKEYCEQNQIERLPNICLPSLEEVIPYGTYDYQNTSTDICVPIGVYDDPSRQMQAVMDVNFSQSNIFVAGSSQYGKTNLLQVMLRGIAEQYASDEVNVYILDFASGILKNFEKLQHVGGVITASEEENLQNFMNGMLEEVDSRKKVLAEMGLSSYSAYREGGFRELPQIVLIVDNFTVLREVSANAEAAFQKLVREGNAVGICLVCTVQQVGGIGYRYFANFGKRIAVYCNESSEYTSLFTSCKRSLKAIPGRCLVGMGKDTYEGQIYMSFAAEKEIEKVNEIRTFIAERNAANAGKEAQKLSLMPDRLTKDKLKELMGEEWDLPYQIPLGMNYETMEIDKINMAKFSLLGVRGDSDSGSVEYMKFVLERLLEQHEKAPVKIYLVDDKKQEFGGFSKQCAAYVTECDKLKSILDEITESLQKRRDLSAGVQSDINSEPLIVLLIHAEEAYNIISESEQMSEQCRRIAFEYADLKVSLILSNLPNENMKYKAPGLIRQMADDMSILMFQSLREQKLLSIPMETQQVIGKELAKGNNFFLCGDFIGKFKTPCNE